VFKGKIICIADSRICISCDNQAYQFEQVEHCELPFCSPECQRHFWEKLWWDFEEMETESGEDLFSIALNYSKTTSL
jgi:hypothetical protein